MELRKALPGPPTTKGDAIDYDPMDLVDKEFNDVSNGRGLSYFTRETLASAPQIAPIITLRINQLCKFSRAQRSPYGLGHTVRLRESSRMPTSGEQKEIERLLRFTASCGNADLNAEDKFKRDSFSTFLSKLGRDSLVHDGAPFEILPDKLGRPAAFRAVDVKTIRKPERGSEWDVKGADYVQFISSKVFCHWKARWFAYGVRRPRSDIYSNGYGFPELDELFTVVTGLLDSLDYNMNYFRQGSITKGILKVIGNVPPKQLAAFKRFWAQTVAGVNNAWRMPILNVPHEKGDVAWVPMSQSNRDMEWSMFNEFLNWLALLHFGVDPSEVGLPKYSNGGQKAMFETNNEARLRLSRERGLEPVTRVIEDKLNLHVFWELNPDFEFAFTGLDALSEGERAELDAKLVRVSRTPNEIRARDDLSPLKGGDILLDQVYTMALQAAEAAQQQQQQGQPEGEQPTEEPAEDVDDDGTYNPYSSLYRGADDADEAEQPAAPRRA